MIKNKKIFCLFMIILSVTIMIQLSHAEGLPEFVEDELLIKFKDTVSAESIQTCENDHNIEFVKEFSQFKVFLHRIRDGRDVISVCNDLNNDPRIEYAEPNYIQKVDAVPNDPMYDQLWGMNNTGQTGGTPDADIDAPEAWDINKGGSNIVVGVIDTGVDYNHEDLAANMWVNSGEIPENGIDDDGNEYIDDIHGIDAFNNDGDPFDDNGHGTHVSGTIGAVGNNGIGVVGVNWNVKIMALKFLGAGGSGSTAGAIECLDYVTMMKNNFGVNIKLTNNSWGGGGFSQALKDAIEASGILFAAAAGNDAVDNDIIPHYPANYDSSNILAVASTDHNDGLSSFSNFGLQSVDIGAPGSSILSTKPGNTYAVHSGTSMATPHASGVAALLVAANPALSFSELKSKIMSSTDPIPALSGKTVTGGRLNAQSALIVFSNIGDEVIIDFGPGTGIWVRKNDAGWIQLHPSSPVSMVTGDMDGNGKDEVIIDFGPGIGIWVRKNDAGWIPLHPSSPVSMVTGDMDGNGKDEVIIDFGPGIGIWVRKNDAGWMQLHSFSPETMVTGDMDGNGKDEVIIDFGPGPGIWVRKNNASWIQLHTSSPEAMVTGNMDGN